jgi:hypothetical protein
MLRKLFQWLSSLNRSTRPTIPNHGPCAECGKDVIHYYPWWTDNSFRGGKPLHDECFRSTLSTTD